MADNTIVKVALIGGGAYLAYQMGWLSSLGLSPTPAVASVAPPPATGTAPTAPVTAPVPSSLDTTYAHMIASANAPAAGFNVDNWGYFLNQVLATTGKTAPDPAPIFTAAAGPSWDRSTLYTGPAYWAIMAPALKTQLGLSGLGMFGALCCEGCY